MVLRWGLVLGFGLGFLGVLICLWFGVIWYLLFLVSAGGWWLCGLLAWLLLVGGLVAAWRFVRAWGFLWADGFVP